MTRPPPPASPAPVISGTGSEPDASAAATAPQTGTENGAAPDPHTHDDAHSGAGSGASNDAGRDGNNDGSGGTQRVYLVTGATGGLGTALSHCLVQRGCDVVLVSKTVQRLETLYDELHLLRADSATILPVDLGGATVEDYQNIANTLEAEFGRLDGIAHCAAELGLTTPIEHYPAATWLNVMNVNVNGPFLLTRACLPLLRKTTMASVVFTHDPQQAAFWGAYGSSKAAMATMATILADETEGFRDADGYPLVAVNTVNPGKMRTRLRANAFSGELPSESPPASSRSEAYAAVLCRDDPALWGSLQELAAPGC